MHTQVHFSDVVVDEWDVTLHHITVHSITSHTQVHFGDFIFDECDVTQHHITLDYIT